MTQLVFVHGVATRSGTKYQQGVDNRDALFRKILFKDPSLSVRTPIWGDEVPVISKDVYDTDVGGVAPFAIGRPVGVGGGLGGGGLTGKADASRTLASVATRNPTVALDALFVELLERYDVTGSPVPPGELEAFAQVTNAMAADEFAGLNSALAHDGTVALIGGATTDAGLAKTINAGRGGPASMSIGSAIGNAVSAVTNRLRNAASAIAFDPLADLARPAIGFFLGDVFTYLYHNDLREKIRSAVRDQLFAAHAARCAGEKVVVIGHSMGGVILVDMLCSPEDAGLPPDLKVDVLLTVGSQPGLFQALGLFVPMSASKIPKPACVGVWYNVFDPMDPLAFRADPIFADVIDLKFNSITGLASAHTTYFLRPQFYARARKRLADCGVVA